MRSPFILLGTMLAVLAACRSTAPDGSAGPARAVPAAMQGDERVHRDLELRSPRIVENTTGRAAEFELANRGSDALEFLYALEWYDARNTLIEVLPQMWQPVRLAPRAAIRVRALAPTARAQSFRLLAQRPSAFDR